MEPTELRLRARRAYELGRVRMAARAGGAALLIAAAALALGRPLFPTVPIALVLTVAAGVLVFRGRAGGRAVWPGLAAGTAAMLLPIALTTAGCALFGPRCMRFCLPTCVVAGCMLGASLALLGAREEQGAREFLLAGIATAAVAAALGCTVAGAAGVAGMAVGVLAAGAPVWVVARPQR